MTYLYITKGDKYYVMQAKDDHDYNTGRNDLYAKVDDDKLKEFVGCSFDDIAEKYCKLILKGVREFKKEELAFLASKKFNEYLQQRATKQAYYDLQEKELLTYKITKQSAFLSKIVEKKDTTIEKLAAAIADKINSHNNIIFNFKHLVDELSCEIDQSALDILHDLDIQEALQGVFTTKEIATEASFFSSNLDLLTESLQSTVKKLLPKKQEELLIDGYDSDISKKPKK